IIRARSTRLVGSVRDREISSKRCRCSASVRSAITRRGATTGSPNPIPHPLLTTSRPKEKIKPNILIYRNLYTSTHTTIIPLGLGAGKVIHLGGGYTLNLYAEAQPSVYRSGTSAPNFQVFTGIKLQFPPSVTSNWKLYSPGADVTAR